MSLIEEAFFFYLLLVEKGKMVMNNQNSLNTVMSLISTISVSTLPVGTTMITILFSELLNLLQRLKIRINVFEKSIQI